jgi:hypothetical protein
LLSLTYWQPALLARGIGVEEQSHLPLVWLGGAACAAFLGAWFIKNATRKSPPEAKTNSANRINIG